MNDVDEFIYLPAEASFLEKRLQGATSMKQLGLILLIFGFIFAAMAAITLGISISTETELMAVSIGVLPFALGFLLVGVIAYFPNKKRKTYITAQLEDLIKTHIKNERSRLEAIKSAMSTAEWENYKLQLQNQRLLESINKKTSLRTVSSVTTTYGFIQSID